MAKTNLPQLTTCNKWNQVDYLHAWQHICTKMRQLKLHTNFMMKFAMQRNPKVHNGHLYLTKTAQWLNATDLDNHCLISFRFIKSLSISGRQCDHSTHFQRNDSIRFLSQWWKSFIVNGVEKFETPEQKKNANEKKISSIFCCKVKRNEFMCCVACVESICALIHVSNHLAFLCERLKHRSFQLWHEDPPAVSVKIGESFYVASLALLLVFFFIAF